MTRRSIAIGLVFACASCTGSSDRKDLPRLDERLKPGQTRAGLVSRDSELLGGATVKGRLGDYKIYNSKIAVIIAEPGASRGFQPYGGNVVDADRIRPVGEPGRSTFGEVITALDLQIIHPKSVEVISDGTDGSPARLRFHGEEDGFPLFDTFFSAIFPNQKHEMTWDVDYVLDPDADFLRIDYTMKNVGRSEIDIGLPIAGFIFGDGAKPFLPLYGFTPPSSGGVGDYYGAIGDDISYLYGRSDASVSVALTDSGIVVAGLGEGFKLKALETKQIEHLLVVGDGDLSRTQSLWRKATGAVEPPMVEGRVVDTSGRAVSGARVHVVQATPRNENQDYVTLARTDRDGRFTFAAEAGEYKALVAASGRRTSEQRSFVVEPGHSLTGLDFAIGRDGTLKYAAVDDHNRDLPVKLSIRAETGATVQIPARFGEDSQGDNLFFTVFGIYGKGVVELPPGDYHVWISRGAEYEVDEEAVTIRAGEETSIASRLARSVSTTGWLATDTHIHSQMSPDSPDLFELKVSAMVTEGLEIPVSTEHEAIGDFNPTIRSLGLEDWIQGVVGSEITTYIYGHFNAFPLVPDFTKPGNGRIEWYHKLPGETFALIRQNAGDPFLQVNHPRSAAIGGYLSAMGFDAASFTFQKPADFSDNFDALEVANGCDLREIEQQTMIDWFAFLNKSYRIYATGSTDNHRAGGGDMGFPRTYVRMPTDEPRAANMDDVRASFKAGHLVVTCGPFVEMKLGNAEIGDTAAVSGSEIVLDARVAAPTWMDVDQIEVVVNGQLVKTIELSASPMDAERFNEKIHVPIEPGRDGWVILRVRGDTAHGVWARNRPSFAFTNPIFLDGNEDGAWVMP